MSANHRSSRRHVRRAVRNLRRGRLQRTLSGFAAMSALPLATDIYLEHYRGSFGNKMMWSPLAATPPLVAAGVAGVFSERAARRALPLASAVYGAQGVIGIGMHMRGLARKPGGFSAASFNLLMGPPLFAPGSLTMVGAIGMLASALPSER